MRSDSLTLHPAESLAHQLGSTGDVPLRDLAVKKRDLLVGQTDNDLRGHQGRYQLGIHSGMLS
jgi:hypothetical protein